MRLELSENSSMPNVVYTTVRGNQCRSELDRVLDSWSQNAERLSQRVQDLTKAAKDPAARQDTLITGVAFLVATVAGAALAWYACPYLVGSMFYSLTLNSDCGVSAVGFTFSMMGAIFAAIAPIFTAISGYCNLNRYCNYSSHCEKEMIALQEEEKLAKKNLSSLQNLMLKQEEEWSRDLETYGKLLESETPPVGAHKMHSKLEETLAALDTQIGRYSPIWQKQLASS